MDHTSALSVAAAVVQFVDFSSKIISKGYRICRSCNGDICELKENKEGINISENLADLSKRLSESLDPQKLGREPTVTKDIHGLSRDCNGIAKEMFSALVKLKNESKHKKWNSFQEALSTMWSEKQIQALQKRFETFRQQLIVNILISLREQIVDAHQRQVQVNDQLDNGKQSTEFMGAEFLKCISESMRWQMDLINELRRSDGHMQQQEITSKIFDILLNSADTRSTQHFIPRVPASLYFPDMADRHERIIEAHQNTLEWIYGNPGVGPKSWTNFVEWLQEDLTFTSLEYFVETKLAENPGYVELYALEPEFAEHLVESIAIKPPSVSPWVDLVVRSLLADLTNGDRISDLQRRAAMSPLTLLCMSFTDKHDQETALCSAVKPLDANEQLYRAQAMKRQLNSRCKGLLEAVTLMETASVSGAKSNLSTPERGPIFAHLTVQYLHRTVKDFFAKEDVWAQVIASTAKTPFNANLSLCRAYILLFKTLDPNLHFQR
ncbi:hypothetical protein AOQ84DRAFT_229496 [Glonium stellatum]|uniref:DUF7791 domain-containing protein n=1 Tax=Glonium stellatum TaxID=574774 RepID=A0A8E2F746_9PEZI|nr:hypothetical protein AOQ84DRAFT_229496 [Glonium stellatum]